VFFATRAALSHLRAAAGTLVFIGSFAGKMPRSFSPVYAASKWWTRGFAGSVAAQAGDDDVAVTVINPSEVGTEIGSEMDGDFDQRFEEVALTHPEEVAEAVRFAAAQDRSMVHELDLFRRDKFTGL
jgi:NADP-dependent 3-hydroxy acid dehydrogenase YdfG